MTTIPNSIPFSDIVFGDRARTNYDNISELAESIELRGTETPIVVSRLPDGKWLLEAGGRRCRALEQLGVTELFFASVSVPGRPGFIVKDRIATDEDHWLTELIENLHRENMNWRDEVKLIAKAWRHASREAGLRSEQLYFGTFGKMVGNYGYADIQAALAISDDLVVNPERYASCGTILMAYRELLKQNQKELASQVVARTTLAQPLPPVEADSQLSPGEAPITVEVFQIPLSKNIFCGDSLTRMEGMESLCFDHIICDPDFAVDREALSANSKSATDGIAQATIEDSLATLAKLIPLAYRLTKKFFVFWYDLDHHEKLQALCRMAGFSVQRWPIVWEKLDFRSNAAAQYNITKNIEYAMVCRKQDATLPRAVPSSVIRHPVAMTSKVFGHPFAKPVSVWTDLFNMFTHQSETIFDPFMGSGSCIVSALKHGLNPSGCELVEDHYNSAVLNVQKYYRDNLGGNVLFV